MSCSLHLSYFYFFERQCDSGSFIAHELTKQKTKSMLSISTLSFSSPRVYYSLWLQWWILLNLKQKRILIIIELNWERCQDKDGGLHYEILASFRLGNCCSPLWPRHSPMWAPLAVYFWRIACRGYVPQ